MHEDGDVTLFLVLCRIVRGEIVCCRDEKFLEICGSNFPPIIDVGERLFIADPVSHTIGIDVRSDAALAAITNHPILRHLVERGWRVP